MENIKDAQEIGKVAEALSQEKSQKNKNLAERRTMLRWVSSILSLFAAVSLVVFGVLAITDSNYFMLAVFALCSTLASAMGILFSTRKSSHGQVIFGSYLISVVIFLIFLAVNIIYATGGALTAAFLMSSLTISVLGLSLRELSVFIGLNMLGMIGCFSVQKFFSSDYYKPSTILVQNSVTELIVWLIIFGVCISCLIIFALRLRNNVRESDTQAEKLRQLVLALNSTTEFSSNLSGDLAEIITELTDTSQDQTINTQEQVASITEVTTSLEELSETAIQIASSAGSAATSANQALDVAFEVKGSSELSRTVANEGNEALEQAVASVEKVRNRIELLGQRLLNLTEQTRRVGNIIDIIDEIADETHLLALNASIEAAGNVTTNNGTKTVTTTTNRGERFGVIAQEIKNLSDRSREATEEVRQAISEMQGAVAAAVLVAEEGKKETSSAVSRSQIAGVVIDKLNEVITESAQRAEQIVGAVELVKTRCDEISVATGQQRSANQQILMTMRNVAQAAHDSVTTVSELGEMVGRVSTSVEELNKVLGQSSIALQPA